MPLHCRSRAADTNGSASTPVCSWNVEASHPLQIAVRMWKRGRAEQAVEPCAENGGRGGGVQSTPREEAQDRGPGPTPNGGQDGRNANPDLDPVPCHRTSCCNRRNDPPETVLSWSPFVSVQEAVRLRITAVGYLASVCGSGISSLSVGRARTNAACGVEVLICSSQ